MAVRLLRSGAYAGYRDACTLFGEPFPPEDVQAYWSMVPDDYVVEFVRGMGFFVVWRALYYPNDHRIDRRIWPKYANQLSTWMRAIAEIHNEYSQSGRHCGESIE